MSIEDLDLRQLRYFIAVAETSNISKAARELRITQPALSRQIRAFEESLGWTLFERGKKSIKLTKAGDSMLREGRRILTACSQSLKRVQQEIEGVEMNIGYAPSLAGGLVEKALACFTQQFPSVRINWFDASTQEMCHRLEAGTLDLILEAQGDQSTILWHPISEKPFRIALSPDHPFAKKRFLKPQHLDAQRLLLLSRHDYPDYWQKVTKYFATHRVSAKIAGEFDGIASLRMGVEAGLGIAFVAGKPDGLKTLALKPQPEPIIIAIGQRPGRALEKWERAFINAMQSSPA